MKRLGSKPEAKSKTGTGANQKKGVGGLGGGGFGGEKKPGGGGVGGGGWVVLVFWVGV